jgi:hypothetical protein
MAGLSPMAVRMKVRVAAVGVNRLRRKRAMPSAPIVGVLRAGTRPPPSPTLTASSVRPA